MFLRDITDTIFKFLPLNMSCFTLLFLLLKSRLGSTTWQPVASLHHDAGKAQPGCTSSALWVVPLVKDHSHYKNLLFSHHASICLNQSCSIVHKSLATVKLLFILSGKRTLHPSKNFCSSFNIFPCKWTPHKRPPLFLRLLFSDCRSGLWSGVQLY